MILITIMMMKMKMKMLWMLMVVMMMIKVYSLFGLGVKKSLWTWHSSEKIDMGGIATKYQYLNDLYTFAFNFSTVFKHTLWTQFLE